MDAPLLLPGCCVPAFGYGSLIGGRVVELGQQVGGGSEFVGGRVLEIDILFKNLSVPKFSRRKAFVGSMTMLDSPILRRVSMILGWFMWLTARRVLLATFWEKNFVIN